MTFDGQNITASFSSFKVFLKNVGLTEQSKPLSLYLSLPVSVSLSLLVYIRIYIMHMSMEKLTETIESRGKFYVFKI